MKNLMKNILKFALTAGAAGLVAVGCSDSSSDASTDILQYVPADSPYVIASLEAPPRELAEKFEDEIAQILEAYNDLMEVLVEASGANGEEGDTEVLEIMSKVMTELLSISTIDGMKEAGIEYGAPSVIYGNGLSPVIRFAVADAELFDAAVTRMEKNFGKSMDVAELKGNSYRVAKFGALNVVVMVLDGQAVITGVPVEFDENQLASAVGMTKPRSNITDTDILTDIREDYGFSNVMVGFFDVERVVKTLTGDVSGQDAEVLAAFGHDLPELSDVCTAEIRAMAGVAPRMVMGYQTVNVDVMESTFALELREDIAAGLTKIPAAVPGLGVDTGGLFSFGFSMNPLEVRNFVSDRLDAIEADPYECEYFADLQGSVGDMRAALEQPIPPMVYGFRGFVAEIASIEGMDMAAGTPPETVDGGVLVSIENAQSIVAMGAMMDPELAQLDLQPDGKPVKLTLPTISEFAEEAYAALTENSFALAFGSGAKSKSAAMLVADGADVPPVMSMHMDAAKYYALLADAMENAPTDSEDDEKMPEGFREAMSDMMAVGGGLYERIGVNFQFTERGIEIDGRLTLAD